MLERETQPFSLGDIIGNHLTVSELMERSLTLDFPEVMIFAGDSGTGKTTTAYIIAALLARDNAVPAQRVDLDPITGCPRSNENGEENILRYQDPKLDSPASVDIRNQRFARDVSFYNAAKLGKDGILALEDKLMYGPVYDGHRTIIIDEAQEISKAGKGAALALLEKKRRDTTFILCTMDLGAFDKAVKGRSRLYHFRAPDAAEIAAYLVRLIEESPIDYSERGMPPSFFSEIVPAIANATGGSVREAVGLLERALAAQIWDLGTLQRELNLVTKESAGNLLESLYKRKPRAIELLESLPAVEAFFQIRRQVLAIKRFQVVGVPREESDAGICSAFGKDVEATDQLLDMIKRIEEAKYVSDEVVLRETLLFLRPPKASRLLKEETPAPEPEVRRTTRRE